MSSSKLSFITIDINDMKIALDFWCSVLGAAADGSESFKKLTLPGGGIAVFLQLVPELKTAKTRMHLDLTTAELDAEIKRLTDLGASIVKPPTADGFRFAVLADPFGNEFCLLPDTI
ncbi:MAG: VOC family protein [Candidatus Saccharibacteria bacterium]